MKVGDLVKENWGMERMGVVLSSVRRSTPKDNHELGVFYGDVHPVVDVLFGNKKTVCDIDGLDVVKEK